MLRMISNVLVVLNEKVAETCSTSSWLLDQTLTCFTASHVGWVKLLIGFGNLSFQRLLSFISR